MPHRKSLVVPAAAVRAVVLNDELGLEPNSPLPDILILLARPEEHEREQMTAAALREYFQRLHFHARVHIALDERLARGELDEAVVRERIERIGSTAFNEIRSVLTHEAYLLPPASAVSTYVEFAAVFLERRYFAPDVLPAYFPSLVDLSRVEEILGEDVDPDAILALTVDLSDGDPGGVLAREPVRELAPGPPSGQGPTNERAYQRLLRDAALAVKRGNDVRAAILHARASHYGDRERAEAAAAMAMEDIKRLTARLGRALSLEPQGVEAWREPLAALLVNSAYGFWNPGARLLYDLQKVCIDFERETYVIDLGAWLRSFGSKPLKRPLPAEREVLMSKHLRTAARRLNKVSVTAGQREYLSIVLGEAVAAAERRLRDRLRPPLEEALIEVGFLPRNLPERVSFHKIVEELLDDIVKRGFFAMGDIRDAIARNDLKLDDLADPLELIAGDRLLRADRRLADVLDGVYQRGPIYLRLLQGVSSCSSAQTGGVFSHFTW